MKWEEAILEIKRQTDIVEVVSRYVSLKRRGNHGVGLCPFHTEKTPSFHVHADKGYFKCFGCQASGDVFSFLEKQTGQLFADVVRQLAKEIGIELDSASAQQNKPASSSDALLYHAIEAAHRYFQQALLDDPAAFVARKYWVETRQLLPMWLSKYQVGFGGTDDSKLMRFLQQAGVHRAHALAIGIVKQGESSVYGPFHGRLIFPIRDHHGTLVGFGARILQEDASKPKYINSPSSAIYQKSHLFYGLWEVLPWLKQGKPAVVVEGYLDVMALQELGFASIAPLGTKVTKEHIALLSRYTKQVVLAFDTDPAGADAKNKALLDFLKAGFDVRLVRFGLKDPASFYEKHQVEQLKEIMAYPKDALEDWIRHLVANCFAARDRVFAIRQLVPFLAACPDEVAMSQYIRLSSQLFLEDERVLQAAVKHFLKKPALFQHKTAKKAPSQNLLTGPEQLLAIAVIKKTQLAHMLIPYGEHLQTPFQEWLHQLPLLDAASSLALPPFLQALEGIGEQLDLLSEEEASQIVKDWIRQIELAKKREALRGSYQNVLEAQRTGEMESMKKALSAYSLEVQKLQSH